VPSPKFQLITAVDEKLPEATKLRVALLIKGSVSV
jgi:hypothetical protein